MQEPAEQTSGQVSWLPHAVPWALHVSETFPTHCFVPGGQTMPASGVVESSEPPSLAVDPDVLLDPEAALDPEVVLDFDVVLDPALVLVSELALDPAPLLDPGPVPPPESMSW